LYLVKNAEYFRGCLCFCRQVKIKNFEPSVLGPLGRVQEEMHTEFYNEINDKRGLMKPDGTLKLKCIFRNSDL
jgi:hypothetical protein